MRASEIESWALKVLDSLKRGEPLEDIRVELKTTFGEPTKIARRLAGHANAARGEEVLWLFGVDEKVGVKGVVFQEFAAWWSKVSSHFESLAPEVVEINVPYEGATVVALLVLTDRVPFVVKNPSFGLNRGESVEYEVPWREMTSVRSAKRSDLLRLLVPLQKLPSVEVISATLIGQGQGTGGGDYQRIIPGQCEWDLWLDLYFTPSGPKSIVFPAHKMRIEVTEADALGTASLDYYVLRSLGGPIAVFSRDTTHDLIITGPERVKFTARYDQGLIEREPGAVASAMLHLQPADMDRAISISCTLAATGDWSYELREWKSSTL